MSFSREIARVVSGLEKQVKQLEKENGRLSKRLAKLEGAGTVKRPKKLAKAAKKAGKRGRGRPPKAEAPEKPSKRRGRPPVAKAEKEAPKRRGRPPKAEKAATVAPKRRGRPPVEKAEKPVSKRRGRPKKEVTATKSPFAKRGRPKAEEPVEPVEEKVEPEYTTNDDDGIDIKIDEDTNILEEEVDDDEFDDKNAIVDYQRLECDDAVDLDDVPDENNEDIPTGDDEDGDADDE